MKATIKDTKPIPVLVYHGFPRYKFLYHAQNRRIFVLDQIAKLLILSNIISCFLSIANLVKYLDLNAAIDIIYDFFNVIRGELFNLFVVLQPCNLFTHILTCIGLYLPDCFLFVNVTVKIRE